MAEAVAESLKSKSHLIVEAGTGVGKSFAYLVPAIQTAVATKDYRVVVSTHTIALQEQILNKDIPFLREHMGLDFKVALAKGRSNYISLRRQRMAAQRMQTLLSDHGAQDQLVQIGKWSRQTKDGTKADLPYVPNPAVWDAVASESGNCLGKKCPTYESCFYFKSRREMRTAHLIIVNHALFFSDLALRRQGVKLLPDYQAVVFDEAHTLDDVAAEHLGLQISEGGIDFHLNKLLGANRKKGLLAVVGSDETLKQVEATRQASAQLFAAVREWLQRPDNRNGRARQPRVVANILSEEFQKLAAGIQSDVKDFGEADDKIEFESAAERCAGFATELSRWLEQDLAGQVYWAECYGTRNKVSLSSAPIDVAPVLQEELYSKVPSVVMTSATLSTGGRDGFAFFQKRLGLRDATTLHLGSPFNFAEQAELHLFRDMPDPSSQPQRYEQAVLEKLPAYIERTQGRAFVLFTSNAFLQKAAQHLRDWFRTNNYNLICQGAGVPSSKLTEQFRTLPRAVLFGVDTFWQGVDVKGEALSNVIVTKLPFVMPDRPLFQARCEAIDAEGGRSFFDYQVPLTVIKWKQGFGRLIRTQTDRGMVVLFDPRVLTKQYGRAFIAALPTCRQFVDGQ